MNTATRLSPADGTRILEIKHKTLSGKFVSATDKQWVLTTLARIQAPVRAAVVQRAADAGFNTQGIVTI